MNEQLIQMLTEQNPQLAPLLAMMGKNQEETDDDKGEEMIVALKKERYRRKKLQSKIHALMEEAKMMDTLLDELAASLGACPSCWGSDEECGYCVGNGLPGAFSPDKRLFETYVMPVLTKTPWLRQLLIKQLQN